MDGNPLLFDLPPIERHEASPDPASMSSSRQHKTAIRKRIVACLSKGRSTAEVGKHIDQNSAIVSRHLQSLCASGAVVRIDWNRFIRADLWTRTSNDQQSFKRPQPIRDKILAYLRETRSAKEIGEHIERRTCIATGHLHTMIERGLVVRTGWGQYIRADQCSNPPDSATIRRPNSLEDLVLRHASDARSLKHLQQLTRRSPQQLLTTAETLRLSGYNVPKKATACTG